MKRQWFQRKDGTYYRNAPLILDEMRRATWRPLLFARLERELDGIWLEGVIEKTTLSKDDVVVRPVPFRVSHPHMPELSRLLDSENTP